MNSADKKFTAYELWPPFLRALTGKASHGVRRVLWLALFLVLTCGLALAQSSSQQTGTGQLSNHPLRPDPADLDSGMNGSGGDLANQQRQLHQLYLAKHKAIVSNTDKLLKLVTELNTEVSSTNPASLTAEQLRTVAAIEKLARTVKDEMRTPVQTPPAFMELAKPLDNSPYRR